MMTDEERKAKQAEVRERLNTRLKEMGVAITPPSSDDYKLGVIRGFLGATALMRHHAEDPYMKGFDGQSAIRQSADKVAAITAKTADLYGIDLEKQG